MSFVSEYKKKVMEPEDVVRHIKQGDKILLTSEPLAIVEALYKCRNAYDHLKIYTMMGFANKEITKRLYSKEVKDKFQVGVSYMTKEEAAAIKNGIKIDHLVTHFSRVESMFSEHLKPDYVVSNVSPMSEDGYFSLGICPGPARSCINKGAKVLIQVNENIPIINTEFNRIHISEVNGICEKNTELAEIPDMVPTELEENMANYIVERIDDGAVIQLGVGGVPSAVGNFLTNHKHLGIHTEVFTDVMRVLIEKGVVDNSQKNIKKGQSVAAFLQGSKETYKFVNENKDLVFERLSWVNDPDIIGANHNAISINSCMGADLRGQVCSECIGFGTYAGSGGQLDFVRGVSKSKGGKSFIAMRSFLKTKENDIESKITLALPMGSAVTTPRNDVDYIVTEYGIAEMRHRTLSEKARGLIRIAHPQFRDELEFYAKKALII